MSSPALLGDLTNESIMKNCLYAACSLVRCNYTLDDSDTCHSRASLTYGTRSNKIWYYDTRKYLGSTGELFVGIVGGGKNWLPLSRQLDNSIIL